MTTDDISRARLETVEVWCWLAKPGTEMAGIVHQVTAAVDLADPGIEAPPCWLIDTGSDRLYAVVPPPGPLCDQLSGFRLKPGDGVHIIVNAAGRPLVSALLLAERTKAELKEVLDQGVVAFMPDGQVYQTRKAGGR